MSIKRNPIQFAVVREDSRIEEQVIKANNIENILMIASGGCTALNLMAAFPNISLTLLDPNASQIELIKQKVALLNSTETKETVLQRFNVDSADAKGLNQCGNFESLFRNLRFFINEMVADSIGWEAFFQGNAPDDFLDQVFAHPYWKVAFELFFSDTHLITMFGPEAVQHAMPTSYPAYFQQLLERGLRNKNVAENYFLHHIFLGKYLTHAIPEYLNHTYHDVNLNFIHGFLADVPALQAYDMVNLSNILDWMSEAEAQEILARVKKELPVGAVVMWRQLNNATNYKGYLAPQFEFDAALEEKLIRADRSLFYSQVCIGKKVCE